jgi:hypothetical protein
MLLTAASGGAGGHGGNLPAWLALPLVALGFVLVFSMLLMRRRRG